MAHRARIDVYSRVGGKITTEQFGDFLNLDDENRRLIWYLVDTEDSSGDFGVLLQLS